MRVLIITNMYPTDDRPFVGTFVEQRVTGLREVGVEVGLVYLDRLVEGPWVYLSTRKRLSEGRSQSNPDLIHVMYGGVMADIVTASTDDLPVVVTFCGSDLLGELLSGPVRKFIGGVGIWCSQRAARRAAGITVMSRNLEAALAPDVDRAKVRIIPDGVDLERFKPQARNECRARLDWSPDAFHVLFPATMGDPRKRPGMAAAAVERLERLGRHVVLHRLEGIPHTEVPAWINASDCLLLTSLHEGSPNVVKEALACDVPVVSVDVGDVAERIEGVEGCYLARAEPDDLASKLALVYDGPRRIEGRERVADLSIQRIALRLRAFYQEIVRP